LLETITAVVLCMLPFAATVSVIVAVCEVICA